MKIHRSQTWVEKDIPRSSNTPDVCTCYIGDLCSVPSSIDCQTETGTAQTARVAWVGYVLLSCEKAIARSHEFTYNDITSQS